MRVAIIQPTPFKKGHFFIYTKSLVIELEKLNFKADVFSVLTLLKSDFTEKEPFIDFNLNSLFGITLYFCFSVLSSINFFINRNNYKKLIILDCEHIAASLLLIRLFLTKKVEIRTTAIIPKTTLVYKRLFFSTFA